MTFDFNRNSISIFVDDITTICVDDENNQQHDLTPITEENESIQIEPFPMISNPSESSSKYSSRQSCDLSICSE